MLDGDIGLRSAVRNEDRKVSTPFCLALSSGSKIPPAGRSRAIFRGSESAITFQVLLFLPFKAFSARCRCQSLRSFKFSPSPPAPATGKFRCRSETPSSPPTLPRLPFNSPPFIPRYRSPRSPDLSLQARDPPSLSSLPTATSSSNRTCCPPATERREEDRSLCELFPQEDSFEKTNPLAESSLRCRSEGRLLRPGEAMMGEVIGEEIWSSVWGFRLDRRGLMSVWRGLLGGVTWFGLEVR